ncbi:MAG: hypothetical protein A3K19_14970 [Lentisphaerae bacterium RIFOXYB12_FULL_65_16]|nr:MAG: hypothetical protein A3K18_01550 [Lentisphaerae bacterium RIFOXYA12_64_32]OGV85936.1 MAG: hypothetical protein A3K19_14970 [Lentisphaerae bacterium RIFOXYB12_FULL_65_16]
MGNTRSSPDLPASGMDESLFCLQIRVARNDAPALEELLVALEVPGSTWEEPESRDTVVSIFAATRAEAGGMQDRIHSALREFGSELSDPAIFKITSMKSENWAETWKRHFHILHVTPRLTIRPVWLEYAARPDEIVLPVNPGMSFGTGYHGTTHACLEFIDALASRLIPRPPAPVAPGQPLIQNSEHRSPSPPKNSGVPFLDIGCGSGILALAAAKLGFAPVVAFDNDPLAVQIARENCAAAGAPQIDIACADLTEFAPTCPCRVVVANVLAPVLVQNAPRLVSFLDRNAESSFVVLSGILTGQYDEVKTAYEACGVRETARRTIDVWTSGCFGIKF